MFRKRRPTNPGASQIDPDLSRSKRQRIAGGAKIVLDIAKESSDCLPFLKSALGFVNALIKHYEDCKDVQEKVKELSPLLERFKRTIAVTNNDGDGAENQRRSEFSSALEEIEKRSRVLLEKGPVARLVDKGEDSAEVARLVEGLREAIVHYQISQQQAIYYQITNLTSSFETLLKIHEKSSSAGKKLDSAMARLDRLCSEDGEDLVWDGNENERREKLFDTLRLIRDNANVLCDRVNAQGYEECQSDIMAASGIAEDIRDALLEYQTTQQRVIYDHACELINAADLLVLNSCRRATGAGYQHGDRKGCLRGTRETVLNEIESWTEDFDESPVFWLNGLAGTGKSTIAQTVSEWLFADGLLGASFFCSRDFKDRSDLHFIFPTLAFQLAHKYPEFRSILVPLLRSNPDIVHESLYSQMWKLIVKPLKSADVSTVIVIDALDECTDDEPQSSILSVMGRLAEDIPKAKFFITGRPEPRINSGFRLPLLKALTNIFILHDVRPDLIDNDIRLFLRHEFLELAQRRRLGKWPSDEHIDLLCRRAAGLFVYAVATVKFLDSGVHLPTRRLAVILGLPECTAPEGKTQFKPKTTLDSLYASILQTAFGEEDPEVDSKVRFTLGAVILVANPLPPSGIAELIGLAPEEVILFLTLVQSLLTVDEDFSQPVKAFHKSFPDFITDPSRCVDPRFYISPGDIQLEIATSCLRIMTRGLEQNILSLPDYALNSEVKDLQTRIDDRVSIGLRYACRSWHIHLTKVTRGVESITPDLCFFLKRKFLAWLEVMSVLGTVRGSVTALEELMSWLQEVAGDKQFLDMARDYLFFVIKFFEVISISTTHIYHSALELSPVNSIIRKLYHRQRSPPLPRVIYGIPDSWDLSVAISNVDRTSGPSVTWSPCGQFVALWSRGAVEIRDALTFGLLFTLQTVEPTSKLTGVLAYSPDGHSLACPSDSSIIIWDIKTGGEVRRIQCDESCNVQPVWSLDGRIIGTMVWEGVTYDLTVCKYDVASGTPLSSIMLKSQDEPHLWANGESFWVMVTVWHDYTFVVDIFEVGPILTKVKSLTMWLGKQDCKIISFSPTTDFISISNRWNGCLRIFDVRNSRPLLVENEEFTAHCFSPDSSLFAASSPLSSSVWIWKYENNRYHRCGLLPSLDSLNSPHLLFSPTSPSILVHYADAYRLWRSVAIYPGATCDRLLLFLSRVGAYTTTAFSWRDTTTILGPFTRKPPGLREGWIVYDITKGKTRRDNSILPMQLTQDGLGGLEPSIDDIGTIEYHEGSSRYTYNTRTGEVYKSVQPPLLPEPHTHLPTPAEIGSPFQDGHKLTGDFWECLRTTSEGGWVRGLGKERLFWLPVEWREKTGEEMEWCTDSAVVRFLPVQDGPGVSGP